MRQKSGKLKELAEKVVRDIRRVTRKQYSAEEKIRIVLSGLRGDDSIAELCRREGIPDHIHRHARMGAWVLISAIGYDS
jgi:transposase